MTTLIEIRSLQHEDFDSWSEAWTSYLEFYGSAVQSKIKDHAWQRLISNDFSDAFGLVAVVDGRLAGIVHCILHEHMWQDRKVCYLQDLFTIVQFRNQGVGTALINATYDECKKRDLATVYWVTETDNHTARSLYDKLAEVTKFIKYKSDI